jgi:hypothetical protein
MDAGARRDIDVSAVFDIETEEWDKFVLGGYFDATGAYFDFDFRKEDRLVDLILDTEGAVWAHFGGSFDLKWLLDHVAARGLTANVVAAGSRIVFATVGKTKLYDSWALCPVSLGNFTKGQGVAKQDLDLPCRCGIGCGGYCSIRRDMSPGRWKRLRQYLEADCKSLFAALASLREFAEQNDLDLGATIGGSAWRNARRSIGLPKADLTRDEHKIAREGYYGGRVQLIRPGITTRGFETDVASMYPWTLRTFELPTGSKQVVHGAEARRAHRSRRPGIYRARISIPEMHLPPLPFRYERETRTAYPTGTIKGSWPLPELEHAESVGAAVVDVEQAIVWSRSEVLFTDWIDRLFAIRRKVGKKTPLGQFMKLYLNSLTGKLGTNPDRLSFAINPKQVFACKVRGDCPTDGEEECGRCCDYHCMGKCGASIQYSKHVFARPVFHLDDCAHVQWSGYLTSQGRIALNRQQIARNGGEDMIYSDTDGIFSIYERLLGAGSNIGEWEQAGGFRNFRGFAPKVYTYEHDPATCQRDHKGEPCDGGKTQRAKGIKLTPKSILEVGSSYPMVGIVGFRAGAALGRLFTKRSGSRKLSAQAGDRIVLADGKTRAPRAKELKP